MQSLKQPVLLSVRLMYIHSKEQSGIEGGPLLVNGLGEVLLRAAKSAACVCGLSTASPFRGDERSLLPPEALDTFKRYELGYDRYFREMRNSGRFRIHFLYYEGSYPAAVSSLLHERPGKSIVYLPHPGRTLYTRNKLREASEILSALGARPDDDEAFFQTMGWDLTIGGPTPQKMKELGIDHFQTGSESRT